MNILVKLSGEALYGGGETYSEPVLRDVTTQLKELVKKGFVPSVVVGGGNIFRGRSLAPALGITRGAADSIGMLATVQNSLVLRDYFNINGLPTVMLSAIVLPRVCEQASPELIQKYTGEGKVIVFSAGLGASFLTTDTTAVLRALEIGAEALIMGKNGVDGIYTADPRKDTTATLIKEISCTDILNKNLKFADQTAIALAKENGLKMKVVAMSALKDAMNANVGTTVNPN